MDRIDKLLSDLNDIARGIDKYEYGLPLQDTQLRQAVEDYRRAVIAEERLAAGQKWVPTLPTGPGLYTLRSAATGIVRVRLAFGGFDGTLPFAFTPDGPLDPIPADALWSADAPAEGSEP